MSKAGEPQVLVCGVGGITGDAVLEQLVSRGVACRALVHSAGRRNAAVALGAVEVVVADYDDADAMSAAMTGVDAVYFVAPVYQEAETAWVTTAVRAAEQAGVDRFVYQSVLHSYTPSMPHHLRKAESEVVVRASLTLRWTILQPAMYAQTVLRVRARSVEGLLSVPYDPDAVFTVLDVRDLAECAAIVLTDDQHAYGGYELAGAERLSLREMGALMDEVTGEKRAITQVTPSSLPLPMTWTTRQRDEYTLMCAEYDAHGLLGSPTATGFILGRKPTPFVDVAARELAGAR